MLVPPPLLPQLPVIGCSDGAGTLHPTHVSHLAMPSSKFSLSTQTDVLKPLMIEQLLDQEVQNLSGGELQRVALTLALGTPADVYLLDEPSAYLDAEQRIVAAKVIKRCAAISPPQGSAVCFAPRLRLDPCCVASWLEWCICA